MKAITYYKYGNVSNLQLEEVSKPHPKNNEVLIKVYVTSVNSWDGDLVRGKPYIVRMINGGFLKPKLHILGCDIAGVIEAIGEDVKHLKIGDAVFGDISESGWGGFAEYVCVQEKYLKLKPNSLSFEQAAAIPQAGGLALGGIHYKKEIQPGDKVLFNGAGGGVGTIGMQIAKSMGAEVTGVDSVEKFEIMRSCGADDVIDYKQEDFTKNGVQYDRIIDAVAHCSVFDYARSLKSGGVFGIVGGKMIRVLQTALLGPFIGKSKKLGLVTWIPNVETLEKLITLYENGKYQPIIDKTYSLAETPQAIQYLMEGRAKGKVVIIVNQ